MNFESYNYSRAPYYPEMKKVQFYHNYPAVQEHQSNVNGESLQKVNYQNYPPMPINYANYYIPITMGETETHPSYFTENPAYQQLCSFTPKKQLSDIPIDLTVDEEKRPDETTPTKFQTEHQSVSPVDLSIDEATRPVETPPTEQHSDEEIRYRAAAMHIVENINKAKRQAKTHVLYCHTCSRRFTSKKRLENHLNRCLGEKAPGPLSCDKCNKTFKTEAWLKKHLLTIHFDNKKQRNPSSSDSTSSDNSLIIQNVKRRLSNYSDDQKEEVQLNKSQRLEEAESTRPVPQFHNVNWLAQSSKSM